MSVGLTQVLVSYNGGDGRMPRDENLEQAA